MIRATTLILIFITLVCESSAQGRRLPNLSFQENSIAFANTNLVYAQGRTYTNTDTLKDQTIVSALGGILKENPELVIELGGHVAAEEDTLLGVERAKLVQKKLIEQGIESDRIMVRNYGYRFPLISEEILTDLPTEVERNAANAKNRRVEVKVIGNSEE